MVETRPRRFRYSPLAALVLLGDVHTGWPVGKIIFAAGDSLLGAAIAAAAGTRASPEAARRAGLFWLWNPVAIVLATRGSWDCLVALLVVAALLAGETGDALGAGYLVGLAAHLRADRCALFLDARRGTRHGARSAAVP